MAMWNPWRGCKKCSDGCLHCYIHKGDTKRIDRFTKCVPNDWNNGYDNVVVCCTIENQKNANYKLSIFKELPIKHKCITVQPLLEKIDIEKYLIYSTSFDTILLLFLVYFICCDFYNLQKKEGVYFGKIRYHHCICF